LYADRGWSMGEMGRTVFATTSLRPATWRRAARAGSARLSAFCRFLLHLLLQHDLLHPRFRKTEGTATINETAVLQHLGDTFGAGQHAALLDHPALAFEAFIDRHWSISGCGGLPADGTAADGGEL
jgi:hypothetical protein